MKISRILLAAVLLGSVVTTTFIQSGQNDGIKIAADRVGA